MKTIPTKKILCLLALPLVLAIVGFSVTAEHHETPSETTLIGEYHWERGETRGDLKAVFTPKADDTYDVSFYFDFRGDAHTYSGEATGSLTDGALQGEVKNEAKNRTFTFEGTIADGKFEGTHAEVGGRRGSRQTGTLKLAI